MLRGWPLLRRAPSRILQSGSIGAMILVSIALLAGLVSAGPLFGSATNAGGLARRLQIIPDTTAASLRPVVQVTVRNGPPQTNEPRIRSLVDAVPYLGTGRTSVAASAWQLDERHPVPYIAVGAQMQAAVLYFRTGAVDALQVVSGTRGAKGVWVPEGAAKDLGLRPGSVVEVGKTFRYNIPACNSPLNKVLGPVPAGGKSTVTVAGTYATAPDGRLPLGSYFSGLGVELPSDPGHCSTPALMLIGDRSTVDTAIAAAKEQPVWTYTADLTAAGRKPAHLDLAAAATARLRLQAAQPGTPISTLMNEGPGDFQIDSGLPSIHAQAVADAAAARQQGRGIAYAGGILGLAAVVVALRALSQRRRRESELLLGLGTPTRIVVAAGTIELLLPTLIGAAAGWGVACLTFRLVGPHPQLDPVAVRSAALAAGVVVLVVLLCNALVALGQAGQISRSLEGRQNSRLGSQWLPLLTGATILAVIATLTRDRGKSYQDPMAALLPILVLACGCSLVARAAGSVASAARGWRPGGGADLLVLRGLRRTGVAVLDLVIVLSIGVGVLAYGLLSAEQVKASVTDKATVLAGAQSSAHIAHSWLLGAGDGPSPKVAQGTAIVWRGSGLLTPDNKAYDLLVVNPTSLREAASWGTGRELADAKAALSVFDQPTPTSSPVPALLVGPSDRKVGTTGELQVAFKGQPIAIRQHLTAFPGAVNPTLVLDARSYLPRLDDADDPSHEIARGFDFEGDFATWIWTRQSLPSLLQLMAAHKLPTQETFTLAQARATPVLASSLWASAYQVILGLAAAALAGLAVVVAVDRRVARAAPVDLILKRFGFRPARLLALRSVELAVTCLGALAVLVLPLAVMVVLLPRLVEPNPALPPSMPVQVTVVPLVLSLVVAAIVTIVAALVGARRSASINPGEVLRDDT